MERRESQMSVGIFEMVEKEEHLSSGLRSKYSEFLLFNIIITALEIKRALLKNPSLLVKRT